MTSEAIIATNSVIGLTNAAMTQSIDSSLVGSWIGFAGSIIGGLLTLIGVWATIKHYKKQGKKQDLTREKSELLLIYYQLDYFIRLIDSTYNSAKKKSFTKSVPKVSFYSNYDYELLFSSLYILNEHFEYEQLKDVINFNFELRQLEGIRKDGNKDFFYETLKEIHAKINCDNGKYNTGDGNSENTNKLCIKAIKGKLGDKVKIKLMR